MNFLVIALTTIINVAALLLAEYKQDRSRIWRSKTLASLGFILAGIAAHGFETTFGKTMLAALVLGAIGDVLLIPKSRAAFLGGIGSFLLGHVVFAIAFAARGFNASAALPTLAIVLVIAWRVWLWLRDHVDDTMRVPVMAYIAVISLMVVTAAGAAHTRPEILLGAILFFASDLSVARDRFVQKDFFNKAWGLPAYYAAQIVMAWCAQP